MEHNERCVAAEQIGPVQYGSAWTLTILDPDLLTYHTNYLKIILTKITELV